MGRHDHDSGTEESRRALGERGRAEGSPTGVETWTCLSRLGRGSDGTRRLEVLKGFETVQGNLLLPKVKGCVRCVSGCEP